jgi:hypothetical protein
MTGRLSGHVPGTLARCGSTGPIKIEGVAMYALKLKSGALASDTLAFSKTECWGKAYDHVAYYEGEEWGRKYWKRWEASLRSARKLGYRIVSVKLVEV